MDNNKILPGEKALFLSGFAETELDSLKSFFSDFDIDKFVLCSKSMLEMKIKDVFNVKENPIPKENLPRVMLISGIQFSKVHEILSSFKKSGLERPIFATTTEHNLEFTAKELLLHLLEEQKMMREKPPTTN